MTRVPDNSSYVFLFRGAGNANDLPLLGDYLSNIVHKSERQYLLSDSEVTDICVAFRIVRDELERRLGINSLPSDIDDALNALKRAEKQLAFAREALER